MPIGIRLAEVDDAPALVELKALIWRDDTADDAYVASVLRDTVRMTLLAYDGDTAVGFVDSFATITAAGVPRWEIDLLAVHPDYRRNGIAAKLVETTGSMAVSAGFQQMRALVGIENEGSQRTFARCGFAPSVDEYELMIFTGEAGGSETPPEGGHFPQVVTLNYTGLWVEGVQSVDTLAYAAAEKTRRGLSIAGAVIPLSDPQALDAAARLGYWSVGTYRWWGS